MQTVSGWVMELFECIPKAGDSIEDTESRLKVEVTAMSGKRVEQVRVTDLGEAPQDEEES